MAAPQGRLQPEAEGKAMIILCADDYALTEGVSRAIGELAAARRLSATSVLVNGRHWPDLAPRLRAHRAHLSIGLHLNLTLGAPLAAMPKLAPDGKLPPLSRLIRQAMLGRIDRGEIEAEFHRQIHRFDKGLGFPPDHIDGHQHVHVLPGVRRALLDVVARRFAGRKPLLRDPSVRWTAISSNETVSRKAAGVAALAAGFAAAAQRRGVPTNQGFSGFSNFGGEPYAAELERALIGTGPRHIVMCHPGHPDAELAALDPVVERRGAEYETLLHDRTLPDRIWRPARAPDGPPLDWSHG